MEGMFYAAIAFKGDISAWDVRKVTNMSRMFYEAKTFNRDVSAWNMSKVTYNEMMFNEAASFNQDLCAWGDKFNYQKVNDILAGSGCSYKFVPNEHLKGPFCDNSCVKVTLIWTAVSCHQLATYPLHHILAKQYNF